MVDHHVLRGAGHPLVAQAGAHQSHGLLVDHNLLNGLVKRSQVPGVPQAGQALFPMAMDLQILDVIKMIIILLPCMKYST